MIILLIISFGIIALAFVAGLAVFFRKHSSISNISFSLGLIFTAGSILGDSIIIYAPELLSFWKKIVFIGEICMATSWLLFSVSFARRCDWKTITKFTKFLIYLSPILIIFMLVVPINSVFYSPEFGTEFMLYLGNNGYMFNMLLLIYSVLAVINFEATLKSTSGAMRWNIKYPLIGVGGILSINIFYYSHALLYRSLNMNFHPVRVGVVLIAMLFIIFSILRHKFMDVEVMISRKIVYKSITLLIVGVYFLGLGVIGEGMRYFGPEVGKNITAFLGFLGAIVILIIVLSEHMRRKVVVFINKNFYSQKYDYREQWLKFTQRISLKHSFDDLLESIVEGIKDAIGSSGAAIWLKEKGRENYVCVKAIDVEIIKSMPSSSFINFMKNEKWVLNRYDPQCLHIVSDNLSFFSKTRAAIVVPLLSMNDLLGFITLKDGRGHHEYNYEDYDLLKTLASQASSAILNARLSVELAEAKEMETVGKLSSFIVHDLKNAVSSLSLVTQNAEEHINNPEFQKDAVKAIAHSSVKIENIIEKLKKLPEKMHLNIEYGDIGNCVKSAINQLSLEGQSNLLYRELKSVKTRFDYDEIKKVAINMLMNAAESVNSKGDIKVVVGTEKNMAFIRISDSGSGMSQEFIKNRLFKPFQTTKSKGFGIGLYQSKVIIEAHEGKIKVFSQEGKGSVFTIYLPIAKE